MILFKGYRNLYSAIAELKNVRGLCTNTLKIRATEPNPKFSRITRGLKLATQSARNRAEAACGNSCKTAHPHNMDAKREKQKPFRKLRAILTTALPTSNVPRQGWLQNGIFWNPRSRIYRIFFLKNPREKKSGILGIFGIEMPFERDPKISKQTQSINGSRLLIFRVFDKKNTKELLVLYRSILSLFQTLIQ